jgi:FkbM family methyltransferase
LPIKYSWLVIVRFTPICFVFLDAGVTPESTAMSDPTFNSYAQNMEDIRLWRALRHVRQGSYIDVGAWDPLIDSVSRGFYELGWRGIHFEPHPVYAARLRADRPDETVYEMALSAQEGTLRFFLVDNEGTSTADAGLAAAVAARGRTPVETIVPVTTLARQSTQFTGTEIHWLKIDVEGMEAEVLRGWDATILRPWIVVVEATRPLTRIHTHTAFEPILVAADYLPAGTDGLNRYYVAREHEELCEAVAEPVSVFDLMDGCQLSAHSLFVAPHLERLRCLEASWSWKITRPLRALDALLRGRGSQGTG